MKHKDIFIYLIAAFISSMPLPLIVSTILYVLIIGYTLYFTFKNRLKPNFSIITLVFIVFYILMIVSYFWSINKELTLIGIGRKSAFLIIPLLFVFIPKFDLEDTNRIFKYFSLAMAGFAIFYISSGFWYYIKTGDIVNLTQHGLVSVLDLNRIYVSFFTAIALFHLIFNEKRTWKNNLLIGLLFMLLILLSSKTILITTLAIIMVVSFWKNKFVFGFKIIISFLLVGSTLLVLFKYNPMFFTELSPKYKEIITMKDYKKDYYFNGSELRLLYTRFLIEYEMEEPILLTGFGLNATQEKLNEKCILYNVPPGYGTQYNFHNQYNQTLAEIGLLGLLLLIFMLFFGFRRAMKYRYTFAIAVFIIFSTLLFTESVFNRQRGIYFFLITYFLIINTKSPREIKTGRQIKEGV